MKNMLVFLWAGLSLAVCVADTVDPAYRVQWLTTVTEGFYNDPANWVGGELPKDGRNGKYGYINFQSDDLTVKAPPEGLVENSGTIFLGCGNTARTLTIDTRGTFWEKRGLMATNDWWGTPFAANLTGSHIFNFESLSENANDELVWRFTDALFTWESVSSLQNFNLRSGTLTAGKSFYLGSAGSTVNFNIHPQAKLETSAAFHQRGNATTHTTFLGGGPHAINGIYLKDLNSGIGTTWMHITNDAVVVSRGGVHLGYKSSGDNRVGYSKGLLDVSCSARLEVTNGVYLGSGGSVNYVNLCNEGRLELRDQASCYSHNNVYLGYSQCSTGRVTVLNQADFTSRESMFFGFSSNAVAYLEMRDDATITCGGVFRMGYARDSKTYATLRDRATLSVSPSVGNWLVLASGTQNAYARFEATDDAVVTLENRSSVEMTMGGTARADLVLSGRAKLLGGSGSAVTNKSEVVGNTSISLSGQALLSMRAVYGGSPADGSPVMAFSADGGTLTVSGFSAPSVPFMSGCVATLGANGLTLDTKGFPVTIDQDFTAAEGAASATITKTGSGALTVRRNSSHPRTRVSEGTLVFAAGATCFGNELEVAPNAYLTVADASSAIMVDTLVFSGELLIDLPTDYSLNEAHPMLSVATPLTAEQVAKIVVRNPEQGKAYQFSANADGTTVSVTVTTAASTGSYTWNAASGDWNVAGNWSPVGVPSHNDAVTVAAGAAITMDAAGAAETVDVATTSPATVVGESSLMVTKGVSVVADGSLTVSAPVRNADGLEKSGSGTFALAGANRGTLFGDLELNGGVTEFKTAAALGADSDRTSALTISNCTFRYSGEATEMIRPLRIAGEYCSVLDIAGDLTLNSAKVSYAPTTGGGIVKTGAGTLMFEFPSGTTELSVRGADGRGTNQDVGGSFAPVNGEVGNWNGVGQFTVLDGKVVLKGQGKTTTTINQKHHCSVGGSGWKSTAAPELHLKDLTYYVGSGNGFHMLMDTQTAKGVPAAKFIVNNANVDANGLYIGYNKLSGNSDVVRSTFAVTNGTVDVRWYFCAPYNAGMTPIVRIGKGGLLRRSSTTAAGGVTFNHTYDVRVEDGGCIEVASPQNLWFEYNSSGDFVLANGGGIKVHRFLTCNNNTTADVTFDGGYAQFTLNGGISTAKSPNKTCFRADAGGGELRVAAGVSHALAIPLKGTGVFTKTGAGTLVVTNDTTFTTANNLPSYSPLTSQFVKIENDGGVRIDAGTLRCVAGTTGDKSRFSGTGTLSGVFGTVRLDVADDATDGLTLADLTATQVIADFHHAAEDPVTTGDRAVVAKLGAGVAFESLAWRAVNLGDGKVAQFACDADGVVTATFRSTGMTLFIR